MVRATFIFRYKKLRVRLTSASGFELISRTLCCYWPLARRITAWSNSKPADWRFVCPQCLLLLIGFLFGAPWSLVVNQPHVLQSDATVRLTSLSSCPSCSLSLSLFLFDSLSFYNRAKKLGLLWYIEKRTKKEKEKRIELKHYTTTAVKNAKGEIRFSCTRPTMTFYRLVL